MQENIDQKPLIAKSGLFPWYLSLAFFTLVTLCSAFFGFMIWNTDNSIQALSSEITTIDTNTNKIASDRKIVVADILKNNAIRPSLNLGPILREFRAIAARSNVRLK